MLVCHDDQCIADKERELPVQAALSGGKLTIGLGDALDGDGLEDNGAFRAVHAVAGDSADLLDDVVAFDDFAEDGVFAGEPGGGSYGDEELAAVGVGAGVCHGQLAFFLEAVTRAAGFVGEAVAGASHAGAFRIAPLDHELGDDAVEDSSVVELVALLTGAAPFLCAFGEADEVGDGFGGVLLEEFADDCALIGLKVA